MDDNEEFWTRLLGENALRPRDAEFTRRVLGALPPRRPMAAISQRIFADTTRFAVALVLIAVAYLWYRSGPGGLESMVPILLFLLSAFAAVARVCGPMIPRSVLRLLWPGGRNWR